MQGLKIGIIEDEFIIAQSLFELLTEMNYSVYTPANNYLDGLELIKNNELDLLLLDIHLGDGKDGIDLGAIIVKDYKIPVIYITAHVDKKTIDRAKLTQPAAYLVKPFNNHDIYAAIEIASFKHMVIKSGLEHTGYLILKEGNNFLRIIADEILFLESEHVYVKIYTVNKVYLYRNSLSNIVKEIANSKFVKTHRSYVVNMSHVLVLGSDYVKAGNYTIPVSRSLKTQVREVFLSLR